MRALIIGLAAAAFVLASGGVFANAGTITLSPGEQTVVGTFALKAGDGIAYTFSSSPDVRLKIELAGTDVFHTTGPATGTFAVTADGSYVVSFRNEGAYLTGVSYSIDPKYNSAGTLLLVGGIGGGIAAVAAVAVALALRRRRKAPAPAQAPPPPPPHP